MITKFYKFLEKRNKQLCDQFITPTVIRYPTSQLSQDKIKAYRLLIHAEIEYYIESIVENKIDISLDSWNKHQKVNRILIALMAFNNREFPNVPGNFDELTSRNDLNFRLHTIVNDFRNIIKSNNGIKEKDLTNLLIRIGIEADEIDNTLIISMNSFGAMRGDLAHNTSKAINLINPQDELNIIERIITDLKTLDELVEKL
jgi:hypothetical protein